MPRPFRMAFGPFDRGLMNGTDAALLPPGAAQIATNVDLSAGTLRGIYTPGASVYTDSTKTGTDLRGFYWVDDSFWATNILEQWACPDFDLVNGQRVLYTNEYSAGNPTTPYRLRMTNGATPYDYEDLGLVAPTGVTAAASITPTSPVTTINKRYAVTFLYGDDATAGLMWESNPGFSAEGGVSTDYQVQVHVPVPTDTRVTGRNVYCTNNDDPLGPLYLYHSYAGDITTTTFTDTLGTAPTGAALTWKERGSYEATPYLFDHSPAPTMSLFANAILSAAPGVTAPGNGILMGANDNQVIYMQAGFAHHCPTRNRWATPDDVRAIVMDNAQGVIFTGATAYAVSGTDDNALAFTKLAVDTGIRAACGKTAVVTPFGIPYVSRQGLMLLQGRQAAPLLEDALTPDYWANLTTQAGALGGGLLGGYQARMYYVFGGDKTVILDLSRWPQVAVTESNIVVTAAYQLPFDGSLGQGLYVSKKSDRISSHPLIRPWMHDNPNGRSASRAAWTWKTGRIAQVAKNAAPSTDKTARQLHFRKSGSVDVVVAYDGATVLTRTLADGVGEGYSWTWLPLGFWKYCEITVSSTSGEVFSFDLEGQVYDAA